jgi:hypothetical protein
MDQLQYLLPPNYHYCVGMYKLPKIEDLKCARSFCRLRICSDTWSSCTYCSIVHYCCGACEEMDRESHRPFCNNFVEKYVYGPEARHNLLRTHTPIAENCLRIVDGYIEEKLGFYSKTQHFEREAKWWIIEGQETWERVTQIVKDVNWKAFVKTNHIKDFQFKGVLLSERSEFDNGGCPLETTIGTIALGAGLCIQ